MSYTDIDDPSLYFNTLIWTGASTASGRDFTGVGFQPDLVWCKTRNASNGHKWFDSVRGVGKSLQSESTSAEVTNDGNGYIDSFDSDGFSSVAGSTNNYNFNNSSTTIVAWNWKAGGSASSNSNGSITSSVSANTTAGFSIVTYTGSGSNATVGHGLGSVPQVVIVKDRTNNIGNTNWNVYHAGNTSEPATDVLALNGDSATSDSNIYWNDTAPTSSVFSLGTAGQVNDSSDNYVAYCLTEKQGYSSFGSYTGNGNADGPFIYLGFRPAWCMFRNTTGDKWSIYDAKRSTSNVVDDNIRANLSDAEVDQSGKEVDFLSNGIKIRTNSGEWNGNGHNIIFFAFAEAPFTNSSGVPCNAR